MSHCKWKTCALEHPFSCTCADCFCTDSVDVVPIKSSFFSSATCATFLVLHFFYTLLQTQIIILKKHKLLNFREINIYAHFLQPHISNKQFYRIFFRIELINGSLPVIAISLIKSIPVSTAPIYSKQMHDISIYAVHLLLTNLSSAVLNN